MCERKYSSQCVLNCFIADFSLNELYFEYVIVCVLHIRFIMLHKLK